MLRKYSYAYFPPIPVLDISFSAPEQEAWQGPYEAFIDSGADFTIVPAKLLDTQNLSIVGTATLRSQWEDRIAVNIYEVDLKIGESVLPYVDIAADPQGEEILLGRNVLNELDLRLEGPHLRTHLLEQ